MSLKYRLHTKLHETRSWLDMKLDRACQFYLFKRDQRPPQWDVLMAIWHAVVKKHCAKFQEDSGMSIERISSKLKDLF